jgi:hypothetical protein
MIFVLAYTGQGPLGHILAMGTVHLLSAMAVIAADILARATIKNRPLALLWVLSHGLWLVSGCTILGISLAPFMLLINPHRDLDQEPSNFAEIIPRIADIGGLAGLTPFAIILPFHILLVADPSCRKQLFGLLGLHTSTSDVT